MKLQRIIGIYFITLAMYLLLDFAWLGFVTKGFYSGQLENIIGEFNWFVAFVFYLLYAAGLEYFAILPNLKINPFITAMKGGFLGVLAYSAYDLTNLATIKNWPYKVAIVDIAWGFLLSFTTTLLVVFIAQKIKK